MIANPMKIIIKNNNASPSIGKAVINEFIKILRPYILLTVLKGLATLKTFKDWELELGGAYSGPTSLISMLASFTAKSTKPVDTTKTSSKFQGSLK
jgi:hypothetical protein